MGQFHFQKREAMGKVSRATASGGRFRTLAG